MNYTELDRRLVQVVPSPRQFAYQQLEFYAFVHFTVNTFTGREWGDGTEDPAIFNPEKLDARQWARAVKSATLKGASGGRISTQWWGTSRASSGVTLAVPTSRPR